MMECVAFVAIEAGDGLTAMPLVFPAGRANGPAPNVRLRTDS
jgi:hypothetical protein